MALSRNDIMMNRKIKADRVYKTLGKMSVQRVVAGVLLLIFVFALAGTVSEFFLQRGSYKTAELCMISKRWMQSYKPDEKALIEAGAALERGEAERAYELISEVSLSELKTRFADEYAFVCTGIAEHYSALGGSEAEGRVQEMLAAAESAAAELALAAGTGAKNADPGSSDVSSAEG